MPETCLTGARQGLILWFNTLLPTLFPFFLVTRLIIELDICPKILRSYYPVFVGLISGYPAGAYTCSEMNKKGQLSDSKAQCLLIACNNASPAFLINYVNCYCLNLINHRFIIWISVISSSILTALMYHMLYCRNSHENRITCSELTSTSSTNNSNADFMPILESTMFRSFEILLMIGGYVMLFSMLANILMCLPISKMSIIILSGALEVTTGCSLITKLPPTIPLYIKSATAAALCGFGGLSAILQTNSAIFSSNLSIKKYILHKLICGIISGILCYIILYTIHPHL